MEGKNCNGGITLAGMLGVAFVVLKLTHVIDWSWWWVTCPFWALPVFLLLMVAVIGILKLIYIIRKP